MDFTVSVPTEAGKTQTLSFHADSAQSTLDLRLPSGTISMSTDLSNPALWGNQEKHDKAMASYLQRFDAAERRGHGDAKLAGLFKDAFVQVNGGYAPVATDSASNTTPKSFDSLNDEELAVLTGLADFQASLVQTPTMPNPKPSKKTTEIDFFSYQIAQQTSISDVKTLEMRERSISQMQSAKLAASYHDPPKPGASLFPPPIDGRPDPDEQSYYYYQLLDQASSVANIVRRGTAARSIKSSEADSGFYGKDEILKADVTKTASQSIHMMHFDQDKLVENVITPASKSRVLDLLSSLVKPPLSHRLMSSVEEMQRQVMLASILDQVLLQNDPVKI